MDALLLVEKVDKEPGELFGVLWRASGAQYICWLRIAYGAIFSEILGFFSGDL